MTSFSDLIGDPATISRMDDAAFDQYWAALGTVVRLTSKNHHEPEPEQATGRDLASTTSASAQLAGPHRRDRFHTTAQPFGFGPRP